MVRTFAYASSSVDSTERQKKGQEKEKEKEEKEESHSKATYLAKIFHFFQKNFQALPLSKNDIQNIKKIYNETGRF